MKSLRIAVIISIFAIMLSACIGSSQVNEAQFEDTTWVLMSYNDTQPIDGTQPTIQFEDGQVSGNAGCNHYGGSYQIKGDAISFGALFMTEMACTDPAGVMEQERIYLELLGSADRFELTDGVLILFSGPHQILTFEVKKDNPILSTPTMEQPALTLTAAVVEPTLTQPLNPPSVSRNIRIQWLVFLFTSLKVGW